MSHQFVNLHISSHPLVAHKMTLLRDKNTPQILFRNLVHELGLLLFTEATRNLVTEKKLIETPLEPMLGETLRQAPTIIPILRAGLGMVNAFLELIPIARVGHIGLKRDEVTFEPHCYYFNIPQDANKGTVFICDPMIATGGSAVAAVTKLKEAGVTEIILVSLISAPEGLTHFLKNHSDIPVYTGHLDRELNAQAFILPGLGDAGDRFSGRFKK